MENLILSRVILLAFTVFNLFIYAGSNFVNHPVSKKAVHCFFGAEVLLLTSYIIYDNLTTPMYCTLFFAIIGYLVVYFFWASAYISYILCTDVSMNKEYDAEILGEYIIVSGKYFTCCKIKDDYGIYSIAYIPIEQTFKEPANKEKDMSGIYKEWSADGTLRKDCMKYKIGEVVKVKCKEYFNTSLQKFLFVTVA